MAEQAASTKLERRTIRHNLFSYALPGGGEAIAFRGATVELMPADIARGEKFDAFTANVGDSPDPPSGSSLPPFPVDGTDAEQLAWAESGTVPEIVAAVNAQPEIVTAVVNAEQRRKGDARKSLLETLGRMSGGQ